MARWICSCLFLLTGKIFPLFTKPNEASFRNIVNVPELTFALNHIERIALVPAQLQIGLHLPDLGESVGHNHVNTAFKIKRGSVKAPRMSTLDQCLVILILSIFDEIHISFVVRSGTHLLIDVIFPQCVCQRGFTTAR